jgi:hypothetical protein
MASNRFDLSLEVVVTCAGCGHELDAATIWSSSMHAWMIDVDPCQWCIDEAVKKERENHD